MNTRDGISPYKGTKFRLDIHREGKSVFVGVFNTREEAQAELTRIVSLQDSAGGKKQ